MFWRLLAGLGAPTFVSSLNDVAMVCAAVEERRCPLRMPAQDPPRRVAQIGMLAVGASFRGRLQSLHHRVGSPVSARPELTEESHISCWIAASLAVT